MTPIRVIAGVVSAGDKVTFSITTTIAQATVTTRTYDRLSAAADDIDP